MERLPTLDQAIGYTLIELRRRLGSDRLRGQYGYDIYVHSVSRNWAITQTQDDNQWEPIGKNAGMIFFDAAWELCRRGILRPSVYSVAGQGTATGGGYSITAHGEIWLREAEESHFIILQPGALAAAFERFRPKFGDGYHQRTQEAIRCRNADAWLATCAMLGAAAESILLAVAITKAGDEERVMREYMAGNGRKRVSDSVIGQAPEHLARPFRTGMGLLSYWRDSAGHGRVAPISSPEADQALRELLSLSQFSSDNWDELVQPSRAPVAK